MARRKSVSPHPGPQASPPRAGTAVDRQPWRDRSGQLTQRAMLRPRHQRRALCSTRRRRWPLSHTPSGLLGSLGADPKQSSQHPRTDSEAGGHAQRQLDCKGQLTAVNATHASHGHGGATSQPRHCPWPRRGRQPRGPASAEHTGLLELREDFTEASRLPFLSGKAVSCGIHTQPGLMRTRGSCPSVMISKQNCKGVKRYSSSNSNSYQ